MFGRKRSPIEQATDTLGSTLDDLKLGAKAGAVKGAAAGALGVLGAKVAGAAQTVSSNGDLGQRAHKAQKQAGKSPAQATGTAKQGDQQAGKKADIGTKAAAAGGLLQALGSRAGSAAQSAQQNVAGSGLKINIDAEDLPRLARGLTLTATGLGTLFAPGSPLDASRRQTVDGKEIAKGTREGIDTAADLTQQRIKDIVDLAKDTLSSLSDTLTSGIETAESRAQKALDQTEKSLTKATEQAAGKAKDTLPKQKGGSLRFLFFGLLIGGIVAFLSSPLSGPLGERVANLRRDLGLGGNDDDDSQYWPSPPQDASAGGATGTTPATDNAGSGTTVEIKTEAWSTPADAKESTDKA